MNRGVNRHALRTGAMVTSVAMAGVAAYLVVVGDSQKQTQLGVLIGLWGLLLAFAVVGRGPGLIDDAAERLESVVRSELDELRAEVAGLRSDLAQKAVSQRRLERIETTRVISAGAELPPPVATSGGGRRRRGDNETNEVLERLLGRRV